MTDSFTGSASAASDIRQGPESFVWRGRWKPRGGRGLQGAYLQKDGVLHIDRLWRAARDNLIEPAFDPATSDSAVPLDWEMLLDGSGAAGDRSFVAQVKDQVVNIQVDVGSKRDDVVAAKQQFDQQYQPALDAAADVNEKYQPILDAAATANTALDQILPAVALTAANVTAAQNAQTIAQAAADVAQVSAKVYASTAAGLAATPDGEYFSVPSAGVNDYLTLYQRVGSVANPVKTYPSSAKVDGVASELAAFKKVGRLAFMRFQTLAYDQDAFVYADSNLYFSHVGAETEVAALKTRVDGIPTVSLMRFQTADFGNDAIVFADSDLGKIVATGADSGSSGPAATEITWPSERFESEMSRGDAVAEVQKYLAYVAAGGPPTENAANTFGTADTAAGAKQVNLLSTTADCTTYGIFKNQCIPVGRFCFNGKRLWRMSYGNQNSFPNVNKPVGGDQYSGDVDQRNDPEYASNQYIRFDYTEDLAWGALPDTADLNWTPAFFLKGVATNTAMMDTFLQPLDDGKLIIFYSAGASGKRRTIRSLVVLNAETGTPGNFLFGADSFFGYGFANHPMLWGSEVRIATAYTVGGMYEAGTPIEDWMGCYWQRALLYGDGANCRALPEVICKFPYMADLTKESWRESSQMRVDRDQVLQTFRGTDGQYYQFSPDRGRHWLPEVKIPDLPTASARTHLIRTPRDRPLWLLNNSTTRKNCALALGLPGSNGVTDGWDKVFTFDSRDIPPSSAYFAVDFGRDQWGRYNGLIYVFYGRGRATLVGQTMYSELITGVFNEEQIAAGNFSVKMYTGNTAQYL